MGVLLAQIVEHLIRGIPNVPTPCRFDITCRNGANAQRLLAFSVMNLPVRLIPPTVQIFKDVLNVPSERVNAAECPSVR